MTMAVLCFRNSHSEVVSDSSSSSRISLAQFELPILAGDPNGRLFEIRKFGISFARRFEKLGFTMDFRADVGSWDCELELHSTLYTESTLLSFSNSGIKSSSSESWMSSNHDFTGT
uniref:Uncharacterized protein n=1 Tax=Anopheles farauti TaxID=69004 RepID=A0A182QYG7_9DIPT